MAQRQKRSQLQFDFMNIPEGVRRGGDVPQEECLKCGLDTMDHTIGFKFESKNYNILHPESRAYCHVCLKDYEKLHPGTVASLR